MKRLAVILTLLVVLPAVFTGCACGASYPQAFISEVLSDGDDTIVAYELLRDVGDEDDRLQKDICLQKLDGNGGVLWDETLFSITDGGTGGIIMTGSSGGVFVAWEVYLYGDDGQHYDFDHSTLAAIDNDGDVRWRQDFAEKDIQMVSGGGGVVMAWEEGASVYARGVDSGGEVLWEQTVGSGGYPKLAEGEEGETLVLLTDYDNYSFLVQKLGADGQLLWGEEGVVVEHIETEFQLDPQLVSDGSGGAIVAWVEETSHQLAGELWLERISADGLSSARDVINGPLGAMHTNLRVVGDEPLGIIAVWEGSGDGIELCVMRDNPLSSYLWPEEGVSICSGQPHSPMFEAVSDGDWGVVVAWMDADRKLYVQRVNGQGEKLWGDEGVFVASGVCRWALWLGGDSDNGFVLGWSSGSNVNQPDDSYLQKLDAEGNILWGEGGIRLGH